MAYKRLLTLSLFCAAALVFTDPALAQTAPRFRISDVGVIPVIPLPSVCNPAESSPNIGLGLNNRGDIVGQQGITGVGNHAFIRITQPGYGLLTSLVYDLNTLYGLNLRGDSIAHDINMNGEIAGQANPTTPSSAQAIIWQLGSSGGITTIALGQLAPGCPPSIAYSINNSSPAVAVGSTPALVTCGVPPQTGTIQITVPFRATLNTAHTLEQLAGIHSFSEAFCVNHESTPRIVGSYLKREIPTPCLVFDIPHCEPIETQAETWLGSGSGDLRPVTPLPFKTEDKARGNNNLTAFHSSQTVGWGDETHVFGGLACIRRAAFWEPSAAPPLDLIILGQILAPGQGPDDPTAAEAINNQSDPVRVQVVGQKFAPVKRALLWERSSGGTWSATDLTNTIPCPSPCSGCPVSWTLQYSIDINDSGWIVGVGLKFQAGGANELRVFLLTPIATCLTDLNGDGLINFADLGILLANWSLPDPASSPGCLGGIPCAADLNCDGLVNSLDLGILFASGYPGPCPGGAMALQGGGAAFAMAAGEVDPPLPATLPAVIQNLIATGQTELLAQLLEALGGSS